MRLMLFAVLICVATSAAKSDQRPNMILVAAEELGRDWVSCYGAEHETPNIDRFATEGVRYEIAWCTPSPTSSRLTLLTGQYTFRHENLSAGGQPPKDRQTLNRLKIPTFVAILRDSGYETVLIGTSENELLKQRPECLDQLGFDKHDIWNPLRIVDQKEDLESPIQQIKKNVLQETLTLESDRIHSLLADFVTHKRPSPFLIYYPLSVGEELPTNSTPPTQNNQQDDDSLYAKRVARLDRAFGQFLKVIDKAKNNHNTIVIFTSLSGASVGGNLNGRIFKHGRDQLADRGAHVPFIVRAPFLTKGNRVSRDLIDFTDLFPTLLDLGKVVPPTEVPRDGKSFLPSLSGTEDPFLKRNWIFSQVGDFQMVRDWTHLLDSAGNFHDLTEDPLQEKQIDPQDKIAPGRRLRLEMILKRFSSHKMIQSDKDKPEVIQGSPLPRDDGS